MKILITGICLIMVTTAHVDGQSRLIDSLEQALKFHPKKDTIRLNILNDLSYYFSSQDPDKGLSVANEAITLATLLNADAKLSTAYNNKGINYNTKGDDSLAITNYESAMAIKKRIGDRKGIAIAMHNIGIIYFNRTDYENALDYQQRAYEIFRSIPYEKGMAATLNSTGIIFLYLADYPKSLAYYLKALKIYEQSHDEFNMANAFTNIGLVHDHALQFNKALDYFERAEKIFEKEDRDFELQNVLNNIGNTYDNAGQPAKALAYYDRAKEINKALGNNRGLASGLFNSAVVYYGMMKYRDALKNSEEALKIYRELDDKYGMATTLSFMAKNMLTTPPQILGQFGIPPAERYTRAIALQNEGLQLAVAAGLKKVQSDAWENLSAIYAATQQDRKALEAYKKHIELRDSMVNDDKKLEIARLTMQYDFNKKQMAAKIESDRKQDIARNALEKQTIIKNVTATAAIFIIFAAGISFIFYERKRKATSRAREAELRAEISEVEMKALRAQMNPHFIFNSLNSISDYISRNDFETADQYLTKFSVLIRMILENSEYREVALEDDLRALELYIQMEALRLKQKFTYSIKVDPAIDQGNTMVPPLLLQPFVENSIWHGLAPKGGKGNIIIEIKKEGNMISCTIEDDGAGIKEESNVFKKFLGMKITRSRIDMLNKLKKANASFDVVALPAGTRVEVRLPLSHSF